MNLGKYERIRELGRGGFGTVWLARDAVLGRDVALKVLSGADPDDVARFQREATLAAGLSHPNIASVHEVGEDAGAHFIAMEYVEGETLSRVRLSPREAMEAIRDAARAVDYAHGRGIVHRDLKPQNLMRGPDGRVTVLDFGLARSTRAGSSLTMTGELLGTPAYMSPEQAQGRTADARSDVYGLGATLYELVTGVKPFEADAVLEMIRKVLQDEPISPRRLNPRLDRDLDTIVMKAMEKDPKRRYATAAALADDLDRALAGDAILAHPPSTIYRLGKRLRKHRGAVCAASIVLTLIVYAIVEARRSAEREAALKDLASLWNEVLLAKQGIYKAYLAPEEIREDLAAALAKVDGYVRAHPDHPQGYYVRARAKLYLNDRAGAEADLLEAVALEPEFTPGWALLGRARMERWSRATYGEMRTPTRRYLKHEATLKAAKEALARARGGGSVERWGLMTTREDEVTFVIVEALVAYYVDRDPDAAIRSLMEANAAKASEEYCNWLGAWLEPVSADAMAYQDEAIHIAPHFMMPYLDRGNLRWDAGDLPGALADLTTAMALDPTMDTLFINRSSILWELGRREAALADLERAVEVDPHSEFAWFNLGNVRAGLGDRDGAAAAYERSILEDPGFVKPYVNLAELYGEAGDVDGALRVLDRAIAADGGYAVAYHNRGTYRHGRGDREGAIADYTKAIGLDPQYADAYLNRALAHREIGNLRGAVDDLRTLLGFAPADWEDRADVERWRREYEEELGNQEF